MPVEETIFLRTKKVEYRFALGLNHLITLGDFISFTEFWILINHKNDSNYSSSSEVGFPRKLQSIQRSEMLGLGRESQILWPEVSADSQGVWQAQVQVAMYKQIFSVQLWVLLDTTS